MGKAGLHCEAGRIPLTCHIKFCINSLRELIETDRVCWRFAGCASPVSRGGSVQGGDQLDRVQQGLEPNDWKHMSSVGTGVREIRIREERGAFRVAYVTKFCE